MEIPSKHNMVVTEEEPTIQSNPSFEKDHVHSFLENTLKLSEIDLMKAESVVVKNGGKDYLNQLLISSKGDLEKIKKKLYIEALAFETVEPAKPKKNITKTLTKPTKKRTKKKA